jgi:hypothetical protein
VHLHPHRVALGLPLAALGCEVADHLLLPGVDADHRLPRPQVLAGLLVEVAELAVVRPQPLVYPRLTTALAL